MPKLKLFHSSGEFHTFRLPVPSLWLDILQKVKAAGLNAVSVYTHMGLINPQPGVIDFDGFRDLQPLFDAAKQTGIWIVLRPGVSTLRSHYLLQSNLPSGPYINAETTAGGLSHWITSEVAGTLRTNATDFRAAWHDYIQGIIKVTASNQITSGGPVIGLSMIFCNSMRLTTNHHAQPYKSITNTSRVDSGRLNTLLS